MKETLNLKKKVIVYVFPSIFYIQIYLKDVVHLVFLSLEDAYNFFKNSVSQASKFHTGLVGESHHQKLLETFLFHHSQE